MDQASYARLKGITLPAAKSRIQRARQRMRERMVSACRVSFDSTGHIDDFVPRARLKIGPEAPWKDGNSGPV